MIIRPCLLDFINEMTSFYVRHELMRHESLRAYSLIPVDTIEDKRKIAKLGFYADTQLKAYVCFSCHFVVKFRSNIDIAKTHCNISPSCAFLCGRDVSISDIQLAIEQPQAVVVLGVPNFQNTDYFYRPMNETDRKKLESLSKDCFAIEVKKSNKKYFLGKLYSPIEIPTISDSNKYLNIEVFFLQMRFEKNRLHTFEYKKFPYYFSETFAQNLAKNGFFYCLLNNIVQCAFCRIVLYNSNDNQIVKYHLTASKSCKFALGKECGNISFVENIITSQTDIFEKQCKICLMNEVNLSYNCGHMLCFDCSQLVKNCPMCRSSLTGRRVIYWS